MPDPLRRSGTARGHGWIYRDAHGHRRPWGTPTVPTPGSPYPHHQTRTLISCPQSRPFGCGVPFAISQTRHQARASSSVLPEKSCCSGEWGVTTRPAWSTVQENGRGRGHARPCRRVMIARRRASCRARPSRRIDASIRHRAGGTRRVIWTQHRSIGGFAHHRCSIRFMRPPSGSGGRRTDPGED